MTIPVARAWLNAGGPVCKPGGMSSDRAAPTQSIVKNRPKQWESTRRPFLQPQVGKARPRRGGLRHVHVPVRSGSHDAQSDVLRGRALACATTPGGGVAPGPAGVVLMNTLFWKILITRVNGKMRVPEADIGARPSSSRPPPVCGGECF